MDRYVSEPIRIAEASDDQPPFTRADLVFYGVDHSGQSYEARVYLDNPGAGLDTPRDVEHGYAGSFVVFGHGGCYGDPGHCDPGLRTTDEFDLRGPHGLAPFTKTVIVTDALRRVSGSEVVVSVVAAAPGSRAAEASDALKFTYLRLLTYL
jgi:tyrosinase